MTNIQKYIVIVGLLLLAVVLNGLFVEWSTHERGHFPQPLISIYKFATEEPVTPFPWNMEHRIVQKTFGIYPDSNYHRTVAAISGLVVPLILLVVASYFLSGTSLVPRTRNQRMGRSKPNMPAARILRIKYLEGRASRDTFLLINVAQAIPASLLALPLRTENTVFYLFLVLFLVGVLIYLAFAIRRLHDLDKSGWWILLSFVPLANVILWVILLSRPGTQGPNRFGAVPTKWW